MRVVIPNTESLKPAKKALARITSGIGSGHLSEILASGLSFRTSISLQTALRDGVVRTSVDEAAAVSRQRELAPEGVMPPRAITRALSVGLPDPITLVEAKTPAQDPSKNLCALADQIENDLMWPDLVHQVIRSAVDYDLEASEEEQIAALAAAIGVSMDDPAIRRVPVNLDALRQALVVIVEAALDNEYLTEWVLPFKYQHPRDRRETKNFLSNNAAAVVDALMRGLSFHSAAVIAGHPIALSDLDDILRNALSWEMSDLSESFGRDVADAIDHHQRDIDALLARGLTTDDDLGAELREWWDQQIGCYWDELFGKFSEFGYGPASGLDTDHAWNGFISRRAEMFEQARLVNKVEEVARVEVGDRASNGESYRIVQRS